MSLPINITAYLIKERDDDYTSPLNGFKIEDVINWYITCKYYVWLFEFESSNLDRIINIEEIILAEIGKFKMLNFKVQTSPVDNKNYVFLSYNIRSKLIEIDIMLPLSLSTVDICLEVSTHFDALLSLEDDGIMDANYLKLFL